MVGGIAVHLCINKSSWLLEMPCNSNAYHLKINVLNMNSVMVQVILELRVPKWIVHVGLYRMLSLVKPYWQDMGDFSQCYY